mgnify:CR=1 FL=1
MKGIIYLNKEIDLILLAMISYVLLNTYHIEFFANKDFIVFLKLFSKVEKIYPASIINIEELDDEFELDLKLKPMINPYNKILPRLSYSKIGVESSQRLDSIIKVDKRLNTNYKIDGEHYDEWNIHHTKFWLIQEQVVVISTINW